MARLSRVEAKARTRGLLLDAAAEVFAAKGFAGASVDEIAERAGFTVGALYSNFVSKEDLLLAFVERHSQEHLSDIGRIAAAEPSAVGKAKAYARYFAEVADRERDWAGLRLELLRHARGRPELRERLAESYRRPREVVAGMVEEERFSAGRPDAVATVILALWEGLLVQRRLDPDAVPESLYADALVWLVTGLAACEPREDLDE